MKLIQLSQLIQLYNCQTTNVKWIEGKKNAGIICHLLTSLVYLQQGNVKKSKKFMKIVHIGKKIFISSERIQNFQ